MDDQTIQSVADADAACLGIVDDLAPFFFVSIFVKIGMADTGSRLNDRYAAQEVLRKFAVGPPTSWIYPLKPGFLVRSIASFITDSSLLVCILLP